MSGIATAPAVCEDQVQLRRERRPCTGPRGITIGQLLARAREGVQAHGTADCPVCGGKLEATPALAARCGSCGSRLT